MTEPNFDGLRTRGRQAAKRALAELAPYDALERVAWTSGWVQQDCLQEAIEAAKAAGLPANAIAAAAGTVSRLVEGNGALVDRVEPRYRARQRLRGTPSSS